MDLKQIKAIIDLMKKNGLTTFKMEDEGFKLTLKKEAPSGQIAVSAPLPAAAPQPAASSKGAVQDEGRSIDSPMVGTFYRAPSPESDPYVKVGDKVTVDTVVCIIEAMKVMNEIKAETDGVIEEVLAENAKPVQFGEPLFRLK